MRSGFSQYESDITIVVSYRRFPLCVSSYIYMSVTIRKLTTTVFAISVWYRMEIRIPDSSYDAAGMILDV